MRNKLTTALLAGMLFGLGTPASALLSGEREIEITPESIEALPTFTMADVVALGPHARYVGSTAAWHIFAEQLTSDEGGMPFDSVYGYKVPAASLKLDQRHLIDVSGGKGYYAFVQACSSFKVMGTEGDITRVKISPADSCLTEMDSQ